MPQKNSGILGTLAYLSSTPQSALQQGYGPSSDFSLTPVPEGGAPTLGLMQQGSLWSQNGALARIYGEASPANPANGGSDYRAASPSSTTPSLYGGLSYDDPGEGSSMYLRPRNQRSGVSCPPLMPRPIPI